MDRASGRRTCGQCRRRDQDAANRSTHQGSSCGRSVQAHSGLDGRRHDVVHARISEASGARGARSGDCPAALPCADDRPARSSQHARHRRPRGRRRPVPRRPDGDRQECRGERRIPGHPGRQPAALDPRPSRGRRLLLRARPWRPAVQLAGTACAPGHEPPHAADRGGGESRDGLRARRDHPVRRTPAMAGDRGRQHRGAGGRGDRGWSTGRQRAPLAGRPGPGDACAGCRHHGPGTCRAARRRSRARPGRRRRARSGR